MCFSIKIATVDDESAKKIADSSKTFLILEEFNVFNSTVKRFLTIEKQNILSSQNKSVADGAISATMTNL